MARTELSPQLRSRVCELRSISYSYTQIQYVHPEINFSTIKTTVCREALRQDNITRLYSSVSRKFSAEKRDYLYDIVNHINPYIKNRDLCYKINDKVKNG
jgi:hypothetical protein